MDATLWLTLLFIAWHTAGSYAQNVTSQFCCISVPWHCIPFQQICDGKIDCTGDGSDERGCNVRALHSRNVHLGVTPRPFWPMGRVFWTTALPIENSMRRPPFMVAPMEMRPHLAPPVHWFGPPRVLPAFMSNPFPYHNVHIQEHIPYGSSWLPAASREETFKAEQLHTTSPPFETTTVEVTSTEHFDHDTTTSPLMNYQDASSNVTTEVTHETDATEETPEPEHEHVDIAADMDVGFFGIRNTSVRDVVERKNQSYVVSDDFGVGPFATRNMSLHDFAEHRNQSFSAPADPDVEFVESRKSANDFVERRGRSFSAPANMSFTSRNASIHDLMERRSQSYSLPAAANFGFFGGRKISVNDSMERRNLSFPGRMPLKSYDGLPGQFKTATTAAWPTTTETSPSSSTPDWGDAENQLMGNFLDDSDVFHLPLAANGTGDDQKNSMVRKRVEHGPYWREFLGYRPDLCAKRTGRLPAPHCLYYFFCYEDFAAAGKCPAGMVFNPAISNCDWPRKVPQCSMN